MPLFIASYQYLDAPEKLQALRPSHREFLAGLGSVLVASGPTDANGAFLIFDAASAAEVSTALDPDPFQIEGLITERTVVSWTPVLGRWVTSGLIP